MVHILEGDSEIGAHVRSKLGFRICLRHLIRSRLVTNRIFFSAKRPIFLHACATCSELPSKVSIMKLPRGRLPSLSRALFANFRNHLARAR